MKIDLLRSRHCIALCFLVFLMAGGVSAQSQAVVKGTVHSTLNQPLSGVSVVVRNQSTNFTSGTVSDSVGAFFFTRVPAGGPYSFTFSGVGYEPQTLSGYTIKEGVTLSVVVKLKEAAGALESVVVVGYGTQSKATVSTAITKVESKSIGVQPVGNVGEALAGVAAGVQVQSDQGAKPGAAPTIRVRGISSLSSSNDPLYVVDGYPLQSANNFSLINPNDIESIEILKDAASAAIYGSRAANGVVIVTTKRGKAGRTVFSVSAYTGLQSVNRYYKTLNKTDFITLVKDISRIRNLVYPSILDGNTDSLPDVNWQKQVFRTAPISNFEINASGGSEKVKYSISAGLFKQEGVVVGTEYTRVSTRMNLDAEVVKNVKMGFSIAPSYAEQFRQPTSGQASGAGANTADYLTGVPGLVSDLNLPSPLNQALTFQPIVPVHMPNGDFAQPYNRALNFNLSPTSVFFATNFFNPVGILSQSINRSRAFRTLANTFLEYTPIQGLKLRTYIGATLENEQVHAYVPSTMAYALAPNASYSNPLLAGIFASDNVKKSFDWVWENTVTYDKTIKDHHFNLLGLFSTQRYNAQVSYVAGVPGTFVTAAVKSPLASPNTVGTEAFDESSFLSYAARLTYDYKRRYLLTAAVRNDGSSRFGPNNRFATFPSFSLGWRVAEEDFVRPLADKLSMNEFKLRGGYGRTGNANIGSFTYVNAITINRNYASGNSRLYGGQQSGFANPDLTWEKNDQVNIGADIAFKRNMFVFTFDYFVRTSKGMLLNKTLPAVVGYASSYQSNLGTLQNRGFEATAAANLSFGKLKWNINANISTYKTKVTDLGGPSQLAAVAAINGWNNVFQVKVGQPLGLMYGYQVEGVFKNTADLAKYAQTTAGNVVGDWRIKDQNGDKVIDTKDATVLGHGLPDFTYGLSNMLTYGNFDFTMMIQGVQGVNIINGNYRQIITGNHNQNTIYKYFNNYFDPAKPDRDVEYPIPASSSTINPGNALVNKDVENGSYLRIRNMTVGYRVPDNVMKAIFLKSARVYATAQNPFLFTKYTGYNPEANVSGSSPITAGVDQGTYPAARTFIFGVNIGF
ncbi:TonB-linked outer membrane protein, SusC/RagA family [Filimonas lacunae]|uniref:TonB-linked outer membrane protein, SusC/RagA family n=1 Tax=Filimonas lacunae TaxID=477680 RepID=A0A1N7P7L2_9BACT|nr:TonB-dependent receptor [Filimonas lacunae]SIT06573.1 TonB-linked outer membrane protein, SusC/RagA family [Filimonas lacunae]